LNVPETSVLEGFYDFVFAGHLVNRLFHCSGKVFI